MKILLGFKTPDVMYEATRHFGVSEEEEERANAVSRILRKWIQYGECVTIEFDTEKGTATVLEV